MSNRKLSMDELERLQVEEFRSAPKIPLIIVLDNVRSMHNVGAIFRTSDAFRIEEIILCGITAKPPHREIQKTALGATETVSWKYIEKVADLAEDLKKRGISILAVEQTEKSIPFNEYPVEIGQTYALVFGHEVKGVSDVLISESDHCLEIPQFGTKHSLNISVCAGIVIWHFARPMLERL